MDSFVINFWFTVFGPCYKWFKSCHLQIKIIVWVKMMTHYMKYSPIFPAHQRNNQQIYICQLFLCCTKLCEMIETDIKHIPLIVAINVGALA